MRLLLALALLSAGAAQAQTVINLPDPSVNVNPNYGGTTTIVAIGGVNYRGPSQFQYFSECARPDGTRYHCNIVVETDVPLFDVAGNQITASLTIQSSSTLITSGHNYWRHSDLVLTGEVTIP